jgi:hypothetical protein
MRRQEFIGFIGGATARPIVAHAQGAGLPFTGMLCSDLPESEAGRIRAVKKGLNEIGYPEGGNVAFEY